MASASQQRFYLEEQRTRTADRSVYAVPIGPIAVACPSSVDEALLGVEAACLRLVERHPGLRTALFVDEDSGQLHQRVLPMAEWRAVSAERGDVPADAARAQLVEPARLQAELTWRPLELEAGSGLRVRCVQARRGPSSCLTYLLAPPRHALTRAVDGWSSWPAGAGCARAALRVCQLQPPTQEARHTPTDWAEYEARHVLVGEQAEQARQWWRERALQVQPGYRAQLPVLGPLVTGRRSHSCHVRLPASVVRQVDELRAGQAARQACGGSQPTRFLMYLALTQLWLAKLTGQRSGAALLVHDSGRSRHPMLMDMVTCTVNSLVLPYEVDETQAVPRHAGRMPCEVERHCRRDSHTPITRVVADTPGLELAAHAVLQLPGAARRSTEGHTAHRRGRRGRRRLDGA